MKLLPLLAIVGVVVTSGCIGTAQSQKGVKVYDVKDIGKGTLMEGSCAAKVKNTNSYTVNLTYKFEGMDKKSTLIEPSNSTNKMEVLDGVGCSSPSLEIISVKRQE